MFEGGEGGVEVAALISRILNPKSPSGKSDPECEEVSEIPQSVFWVSFLLCVV